MKVDYHFHPNLPLLKDPSKRLRKIWEAFGRFGLDAVICTEHAFKDPARAYRELLAARPNHLRTHIFPGAELVTNDSGPGIDVIVFSEEDWYEDYPELLEPYNFSLFEMLEVLEGSDLSYFIPHPYLLRNPLKKLFRGTTRMRAFLSQVEAFEYVNGCYLSLEKLCSVFPFGGRRARRVFQESARPSPSKLPLEPRTFVAVGSDAHHPRDVGLSLDISCEDPEDRHAAFRALTRSNASSSSISYGAPSYALPALFHMCWTTFDEALQRRVARFNAYHQTSFSFKEKAATLTMRWRGGVRRIAMVKVLSGIGKARIARIVPPRMKSN